MLPPITSLADHALDLIGRVDAMVMHGGGDVDPRRYGEEPSAEQLYGIVPEHDEVELAVVHAALEADLPTLAICRGMQVVNVAMGGTLPTPVRGLLAHALSRRAKDLVDELVVTEGSAVPLLRSLRTVIDDAGGFGVTLDLDDTVRATEQATVSVLMRVLGEASGTEAEEVEVERARRLLGVMQLLAGERPLLRLLKSASALSNTAATDPRFVPAATVLVPLLNAVCRSRFPLPLASA
jgi:hypothetical protein